MTAKRTTIRGAADFISRRELFRSGKDARTFYSGRLNREDEELYVVYSYTRSFPLAIWSPLANQWFYHSAKYSRTTSNHQSSTLRGIGEQRACAVSLEDVRTLQDCGYIEWVRERLT